MSTLAARRAPESPAPHTDAAARHTIPVIDRMMDVLGVLERQGGVSISGLTAELRLPRTTVYRILNTLQTHDMVRREADGGYRLGSRLVSLASSVGVTGEPDLAAVAQPIMERLAAELGNSAKLSVLDGEEVLVVAVAQGRRHYALTVTTGQRMPIHAGAAGKLLFAFQSPERQAALLGQPLSAFTSKTLVEPRRLRAEATRIRRQGWAQDRGESAPSIFAYAAPVLGRDQRVVAALSLPFLAGTEPERMEAFRAAVVDAAAEISARMAV